MRELPDSFMAESALSPDGEWLVTAGDDVRIVSPETLAPVATFDLHASTLVAYPEPFSADGSFVAVRREVAGRPRVSIIDVDARRVSAADLDIRGEIVSLGDAYIWSATKDEVQVFDLDGRLVATSPTPPPDAARAERAAPASSATRPVSWHAGATFVGTQHGTHTRVHPETGEVSRAAFSAEGTYRIVDGFFTWSGFQGGAGIALALPQGAIRAASSDWLAIGEVELPVAREPWVLHRLVDDETPGPRTREAFRPTDGGSCREKFFASPRGPSDDDFWRLCLDVDGRPTTFEQRSRVATETLETTITFRVVSP